MYLLIRRIVGSFLDGLCLEGFYMEYKLCKFVRINILYIYIGCYVIFVIYLFLFVCKNNSFE